MCARMAARFRPCEFRSGDPKYATRHIASVASPIATRPFACEIRIGVIFIPDYLCTLKLLGLRRRETRNRVSISFW
jgi:hypothetical protein